MSELERHETIGNEIFDRINAVRNKDRADALATVNRLRKPEEVTDGELVDAFFYFSTHLDICNPLLPVCSEVLERFMRRAEIKETPRGLTLDMMEEAKRDAFEGEGDEPDSDDPIQSIEFP